MTLCGWCTWPGATMVLVENMRERLCARCLGLVVRYRIANVRL